MIIGIPRWGGCLWFSAAALMVGGAAARADFTVSYNDHDRRISIVDNATGAVVITPDLAVHQRALTPNAGSGDTTIEPTVSWSPHGPPDHGDGLDIRFTFENTGDAPARPGPIFVPGITFGLADDQMGVIHTRDFYRDGKAFEWSPERPATGWNTAQELKYPDTLFSPLAFLNAGHYAVGVSVLYPVVDPAWDSLGPSPNEYAHRIGLSIQLPNPEGGGRAWQVRVALASADFGGGDPGNQEGLVPPHSTRQYTVCVRVTDRLRPTVPEALPEPLPENEPDAAALPQEWLRLFEPYKEYFAARYGGIRYTPDLRPVMGCATTQINLVSPSNPFGFAELPGGGGRPFPDGWGRWHEYLQLQHTRGWKRTMVWTPSGVFSSEAGDFNFPFQFTSQWARQVVPGGEPTLLRDLTDTQPDGGRLGLWWGNSVIVMTTWPPKLDSGIEPLDPTNPQHRALVRAELDGAVNTANAEMIGLDAFSMPAWKSYRWLRQMRAWYPTVRFIQEAQPCDIMATLSPGYIAGTRSLADADLAVKTPCFLAEYLTPGHELWASVDQLFLQQALGSWPTEAQVIAKMREFAGMGYVPLMYGDPDLTGQNVSATRPSVVPCDLLFPRVLSQPPAEVRAISGQPVAIAAEFSDPALDDFHWHRSVQPDAWIEVNDGGSLSGTASQSLHFDAVRPSDSGLYRLRGRDRLGCTDVMTSTVRLVVCASPDFNQDGDSGTDGDIEAFFACLGGSCCASCDTADVNGDGETGTDADIEAFFRVLAGGGC